MGASGVFDGFNISKKKPARDTQQAVMSATADLAGRAGPHGHSKGASGWMSNPISNPLLDSPIDLEAEVSLAASNMCVDATSDMRNDSVAKATLG